MKIDEILIKFKCGVNIRRFRALIIDDDFELSVPELKQKVIALFSLLDKPEHLVLTYIDEHGDEVDLVDEEDLSDVADQRLHPLRISVYHISTRTSLLGPRPVAKTVSNSVLKTALSESTGLTSSQRYHKKHYFRFGPKTQLPEQGNDQLVVPSPVKKKELATSLFVYNNLNSCLVEDLTVDITIRVAPSTLFKKIWRMKNIGRVEWPHKTELIWIGGDRLSNQSSFEVELPLSGLPVGEEADVVVDLTAPVIPDEYIAFWRLASPSGERFGQRIKVIVKVGPSVFY